MLMINETHDINLTSWVSFANSDSDFPIQNLPFAIFKRKGQEEALRGGVAIGNQVLDLAAVAKMNLFSGSAQTALEAASQSTLNTLMNLGVEANSALRLALSKALRTDSPLQNILTPTLIAQDEIEFGMPCQIGDYTDFYTSIYHATAIGKLFRPDNPLLPNYKWIPIGYHGRSSTIGISGQTFHRPVGQTKAPDATEPSFGPCKRLDYELEMGLFVGKSTQMGELINIENAEKHLFGVCIFNDWSARDIQAWEYQPLGPFLAKSFASTISPWIVTMEALAPYRSNFTRPETDPQPLPHLSSEQNTQNGGLDINLSCFIQTQAMLENKQQMAQLSKSNFKYSYWTPAQLITHHASNGCAMRSGDLLGSGTQSGPTYEEAGSLLELSKGGKIPIDLPNGEKRTFLEDGDTIIMRASCSKEGAVRIGFGEVVATVLPAKV
ncbi:fumarylacetoacetase [Paraglaciecola psychrophila]|uniref:fumarylacetoacetase n=1 Tax=Paraglaciecola psychrophila 170 TaxID=1129794 RepID=K7AID4_9ALTE|nr:fumarylacetoacetase [Paraglaciecola psychrophila]AGH44284.1 fumarylacetoacetase [Paraglaciecola psychrophila 170]GAC40328.1 fumarylacetoacetase [Paraglaciecola psychrophila 170]